MSIMNTITWKSMLKNRNRTLVTLIAIILAAAVFTAILTMAVSAIDFLIRSETKHAGGYYARFSYLDEETAEEIAQNEVVKTASFMDVLGFVKIEEKESNWSSFILAEIDDTFSHMMPITLLEGRMPENATELLLPMQAIDVFSYYGLPCTIGETVTLESTTHYEELSSILKNTKDTVFSESYTIVGIYDNYAFDEKLILQTLLTCPNEKNDVLYRNLFVTTKHPADAYKLANQYSDTAHVHTRLLSYYGATAYANYNFIIWLIASAVILVIMIAAISVIYHAFSVSVSERTKDFGLLCSIGATKKQIRKSVMFEAGLLSCLGIPIGFFLGFLIDVVLFSALGKRIANLIVSAIGEESVMALHAVLSPAVIFSVIFVTVITVMLSALIPAVRAGRTIPMDAIRQTSAYKIDKKTEKQSKKVSYAFGVAGMMARKYNRVSRKKFRPIVMALTLCIVMLITATSLGGMIETVTMAGIRIENHDFRFYQITEEQIQMIKDSGLITKSAWIYEDEGCHAYAPDDDFSEEFRKAFADIQTYYTDRTLNIQNAKIVYVEDSVLESYLIEHGMDTEPYLDSDDPTALVCDCRLFTPHFQDENGEWIRYSYQLMPFDKKTESVLFLKYFVPEEIQAQYMKEDEAWMWGYVFENDKILAKMTPNTSTIVNGVVQMGGFDESRAIYFEMTVDKNADGTSRVSYYEYDKKNGTSSATPICVMEGDRVIHDYKIGAYITERPFGVGEPVSGRIELILPLSASESSSYWAVNTNQYLMFKSFLDETGIRYTDNCEQEETARTVRMLLDVVSYGFVGLISVLSLASALNTISASIIMRRREFGMLRSLGFEKRKIYHILILENIFHGSKAVLIGVPIGLLIHIVIYLIQNEAVVTAFSLPWKALLLSVGCVMIITALGILCALGNLKKVDLMESLKNENI